MRLIDADALIDDLAHGLWGKDWDKALAEAIIRNAPTIDAVPVVRCKECRYSDDYYNDGSCYCKHPEWEMRYIGTNWNWYCADGKGEDDERA